MTDLLNLKQGLERKKPLQVVSADGAITIKEGLVVITKGSAAVITLADPVAGIDDSKVLHVYSNTAFAHTVTLTSGLAGVGAGADVGTFTAAAANRFAVFAYQGFWYLYGGAAVNVTFA